MVRPSQRREMAKEAVASGRASIRHACQTFGVSETCYRYEAIRRDEDAEIADWLIRLTTAFKDWGFGLCFLHLRNVKGFYLPPLLSSRTLLRAAAVGPVVGLVIK